MLTGIHQAGESHFEILTAFADRSVLDTALAEATRIGCRRHEFGDANDVNRQAQAVDDADNIDIRYA